VPRYRFDAISAFPGVAPRRHHCRRSIAPVGAIDSSEEKLMFARMLRPCSAAVLAFGLAASSATQAETVKPMVAENGVVMVRSAYPMAETLARLKKDIADKGITFFLEVDQSKLAGGAGIALRPSTLLIFGNPGLGSHFITANPAAGLDWPVRLLVFADDKGQVWTAYTDFAHIARRHGITSRDAEFTMASAVIGSITGSVAAK
jgi:uncharacterized protein (DUF302 family)